MSAARRDGARLLGVGAAACVACCAGPIVAFLGGLGIVGVASTLVIGVAGLLVTAAAAIAIGAARHRRRASCAARSDDPVPVSIAPHRSEGP